MLLCYINIVTYQGVSNDPMRGTQPVGTISQLRSPPARWCPWLVWLALPQLWDPGHLPGLDGCNGEKIQPNNKPSRWNILWTMWTMPQPVGLCKVSPNHKLILVVDEYVSGATGATSATLVPPNSPVEECWWPAVGRKEPNRSLYPLLGWSVWSWKQDFCRCGSGAL